MSDMNDTIAAISTASGEAGIGVVRMSGKDAIAIADRIFVSAKGGSPSSCKSHTVHYGHIAEPRSGNIVDEALITVMRAPGTYTSDDTIEINCHGGSMPSRKILEICLDQGARIADPGEFTKRAFMSGRLDLAQAEAVLDIIKAETSAAMNMAARQLDGEFSLEVRELRDGLIQAISRIELGIDFSGEDVEFSPESGIIEDLSKILIRAGKLAGTSEKGMMLRQGASVVICGKPNVGKSSLMNALLRHERVIVAPVAGTTRDIVEENINLSGIKVKVSDTAGIIDTTDRVEIEGIRRSREKLEAADVAVLVFDRSRPFSKRDESIYDAIKHKKTVVVANKSDLPPGLDVDKVRDKLGIKEILEISALKKKGLDAVEDSVAESLLQGNLKIPENVLVTNIRHKELLDKAVIAMDRSLKTAREKYNGELLAADLNDAAHQLGLIIGESIEDDVLDRIFSEFCIGK